MILNKFLYLLDVDVFSMYRIFKLGISLIQRNHTMTEIRKMVLGSCIVNLNMLTNGTFHTLTQVSCACKFTSNIVHKQTDFGSSFLSSTFRYLGHLSYLIISIVCIFLTACHVLIVCVFFWFWSSFQLLKKIQQYSLSLSLSLSDTYKHYTPILLSVSNTFEKNLKKSWLD